MSERRERKGRSKEQSLWLALVWVVTLAAMVGLGILLGKYVLSYCASSLQAPRTIQSGTTGSNQSGSSNLTDSLMSKPPISPTPTEGQGTSMPSVPPASTQDTAATAPESGVVAADSTLYRVQVGEFYDRSEAETLGRELEEAGYPIFITSSIPYRIQVGAFREKPNADKLASELEAKGYSVVIQR